MTHQTSDDDQRRSDLGTPFDPRKRAELVRAKLVELIRDGRLKEGEKLPTEPQLSAMFGVGRSTVREAVQSLVGLGLVEMRAGRGAFIRRASLNDLVQMVGGAVQLAYGPALEVHEVRAMMEITASRLAAIRRTDADLARMKDAILHYRIADHADDPEGLIDADLAFHTAIIEATRNQVLAQLFASIAGLLREHRRQYGVAGDRAGRQVVVPEHERILAAIATGNPREAALQMQRHMGIIWRQIERTASHDGESLLAGESYLPLYDGER